MKVLIFSVLVLFGLIGSGLSDEDVIRDNCESEEVLSCDAFTTRVPPGNYLGKDELLCSRANQTYDCVLNFMQRCPEHANEGQYVIAMIILNRVATEACKTREIPENDEVNEEIKRMTPCLLGVEVYAHQCALEVTTDVTVRSLFNEFSKNQITCMSYTALKDCLKDEVNERCCEDMTVFFLNGMEKHVSENVKNSCNYSE